MQALFDKSFYLFALPGGTEWILILVVILLFFGGRKIPDLMRGIGKGVKEFNDAKDSMKKNTTSKSADQIPDTENKDAVEKTS